MANPVWKTDLLTLEPDGVLDTKGKLNPYEPTIAFAINRPPALTFAIENQDPLIGYIDELRTRVKAWRSPQLGAAAELKLYNVIGACKDTFGTSGGCAVGTMGPLYYLTRRYAQADTIFDTVDQHEILKQMIDTENARFTTQIRTSETDIPDGADRTVSLPKHKQIFAAALELASLYGGFEFDTVPVEDVADVMADLRIHYPQQGEHRPEVFLEHGLGKRNIIGGERDRAIEKITTDLTMLGRTEGADTLTSVFTDDDRREMYGALLESIEGFTDISEQDQLDLLGEEIYAARATPRDVYRIEVADTFEYAPFDDFDLGDTLPARIREGRIDIDGTVRVWGFELKVLSTGEERLTSISISPEGD